MGADVIVGSKVTVGEIDGIPVKPPVVPPPQAQHMSLEEKSSSSKVLQYVSTHAS